MDGLPIPVNEHPGREFPLLAGGCREAVPENDVVSLPRQTQRLMFDGLILCHQPTLRPEGEGLKRWLPAHKDQPTMHRDRGREGREGREGGR